MDYRFSPIMQKNTLTSGKRRAKIVHVVIIVHLAIIFLPLSYLLIADYWKNLRKKEVVTVRLVEIPKQVTPKTVKKSSGRRSSVKPRKKPKKKKTVAKKIPKKPMVEPKPVKRAAKKTAAKTVSTKKVAKTTKRVAPPKKTYTPPDLSDFEIVRPEDLKKVPTKEPEEDDDNDDEVGATYREQLVGVIYQLWNPPSKQLLNGRKPEVYVKIRFNRYGRVLSARITKGSNFLPMNRSVAELLKNLTQVPAPPPGEPMEIEFVFVPQE
ncbi:MAG: TonB C-terminal domain-containing protein [Lentisphaeria bacterium]|nr:TonB C-terminal domain-containing protein [Lentisphaeria bacterium]